MDKKLKDIVPSKDKQKLDKYSDVLKSPTDDLKDKRQVLDKSEEE